MVKRGFYDSNRLKVAPLKTTLFGSGVPASSAPVVSRAPAAARPQPARVVPLPSKDFLRVLQPNALLAVGFDFEKISRSPEIMEAVFGAGAQDEREKLIAAIQEMDHFWMSIAEPHDIVILMTGKFERGGAANLFYSQGIRPVFLGDAHAMIVGPEPSVQAALARLAHAPAGDEWVASRARQISKDHDGWVVAEPGSKLTGALKTIRRFALGFRWTNSIGTDAEVVADSDAGARGIADWIENMKTTVREKTGVAVLDALKVSLDGSTVRIAATGGLLEGDAGKAAMNSDFGAELYNVLAAGLPGAPKTVAADKIASVKMGMSREEVLALLGPPVGVTAIQGLDTPRETWIYQVPFGKQVLMRLEGGVVSQLPR